MKINKLKTIILHYLGLNALACIFLKHKIYILNYHSVSSADTDSEFNAGLYKNLSIEKDMFESHIRFLKNKRHTFINFNDLLNINLKNINKPTIIYFDDGFKDNIKNALPVLKKYKVKATVFITTDIADGSSTLWTIKHRAYLKSVGVKEEKLASEISKLKKMSKDERERKLNTEYKEFNFNWDDKNKNIFLNWDNIRELSKNNIEIGSHSISHPNLLEIDSKLIEKELKESKRIIENKIGKNIKSFSYPYGKWNDDINEICKDAGYSAVVSKGLGLNSLSDISGEFFVLKTVPVKISDSAIDLEAKLYVRYFLRK